jgi:thioredoxin reductase
VFEPDEEQAARLAARGGVIERTPVVELLGTAPALGAVFTALRTHMASPLARALGCAMDDGPQGRHVRVDERKQTTVAGVYAAGDAASPMHNATMASAAGVMAGVGAHQSLMAHRIRPAEADAA